MLLVGRVGFYKVFLACLLMSILNSLLFAAIAAYGFNDIKLINNPIETEGLVSQIILACVVAPLLETLLLVKLPNILLQKAGIKNSLLLIIIPAALFGLLHHYSLLYIVVMFGNGLVMNFFYIYCLKTGYRAFYRVALLHCLYNLFAVLMP
ncbi:type II CAAX prenyl endopeptidase Rce1 family protein [Mucilaginibacter sp. AK015]|uniref:CPBP family glutamic-type intramembrane protease n=1 Tax=Mucilaginibacter sp. AK015 TaxID=2723072 RepID=UPI0017BE8EDE|nr:CPBP family glutamic-type intramembrane protease [Mucilaginibacter sp. AK015]MBB5395561.1 membrane protease YdiL (CAAX protease family) [Mucilaginibacter sp. AK015]